MAPSMLRSRLLRRTGSRGFLRRLLKPLLDLLLNLSAYSGYRRASLERTGPPVPSAHDHPSGRH